MIIDNNIHVLSNSNKHFIDYSEDSSINMLKYEYHEKQNVILIEKENEEIVSFIDKIDEKSDKLEEVKQLVFIIGIASINEIQEKIANSKSGSKFIIIEPSIQMFTNVLHKRDLSFVDGKNVYLFTSENEKNLLDFIQLIINDFGIIKLMQSIDIFITQYYRRFDTEKSKIFINELKVILRNILMSFGNSIQDSLIGLKHNVENLKYLIKSKDISKLKGEFKNYPAVIVSAGPSLTKNIDYLKEAQGKSIIIAVDTILAKLLAHNIIPDFVCSIERKRVVFDYFYKDIDIPKEVTLVGPSLLDPRIFDSYRGNIMLPFRTEVNEYRWLKEILEIDGENELKMGTSCAHVAFGLALHLGCENIILIGQDLAYGTEQDKTHVEGTKYDSLNLKTNDEIEYTDGYFGGKVKTTKVWNLFRYWFETQCSEFDGNVINATEGGARINHTIQQPLSQVIKEKCLIEVPSIYDKINELEDYNINLSNVINNINKEIQAFEGFNDQCIKLLYYLRKLELDNAKLLNHREYILNTLSVTDALLDRLLGHKLLTHNLQSVLLNYYWNVNKLVLNGNLENLELQRKYQIQILEPVIGTIAEIMDYLNLAIDNLKEELKK